MAEDFNVRFGSNARAFSRYLINDLKPARAEIESFIGLLGRLDAAGKQAITNANRGATALGGGRTGGATVDPASASVKIDMSGVERELQSVTADLSNLTGKLGDFITKLGKATSDHNRNTGQQERVGTGQGNFVGDNGRILGSRATSRGQLGPDISNAQHAALLRAAGQEVRRQGEQSNRTLREAERAVKSAQSERDRASAPSGPIEAKITDLTKLQLDQGGFDRVVGKLEEIKAAIEARGGVARVSKEVDKAAPTKTTTGAKGKKAGEKLVEETAVTAQEMQGLREMISNAQDLIIKQYGGNAPEAVTQALTELRSKLAAKEARAEREATGISRPEQSAKRRRDAEADRKKIGDLTRAEYDARKEQLRLIQEAGRADFAEAAKRRGKGGKSHDELISTAQAFQNLGIDVEYGSKTTKSQLADRIATAHKAYRNEYGNEVPEQLRVGSRPAGPDKVSSAARSILGNLNATEAELEEERKARNIRQLAYQVGNLPKDPTHRALENMPGTIGVPPGMVKGGGYYDAFGFNDATALIDQRALGRAAVRASDPGFNPFKIREKDEISGQGPEATDARRQLREIKRATRELDQLGTEYDRLATSLRDNRRGTAALEARIGTDREKKGDGQRLRDMEQSMRYAQRGMESQRFAGLQDLFEDPAYQSGRRQRQDFLANQEDERRAAQEAYEKEHGPRVNVNDAAASAIAGARTSIGSRGYRRPIPGLRPDGANLAFTDDDRDPKDLKKLNKAFRSYRSGLRREVSLAEDLAQGVEGITEGHVTREIERTDNKITSFLNQLDKLFGKGVAPGFEELIGRAPQTDAAIESEARRNAQRVALNQVMNAKPRKRDPLEIAAEAAKSVTRTQKALDEATKELAAAEKAESKALGKAAASQRNRPSAEQADIEARTQAEIAQRRLGLNQPIDNPRFKAGAKLVGKTGPLTDEEIQQLNDYREYAAGHAARTQAAQHDLSLTTQHDLTPEEQAARDARVKRSALEARQRQLAAGLSAQQARLADAQEKIGGKEPEITTLQKKLTRSQNLRKERATLRAALKTAQDAEDTEAAADARAELAAFREKNRKYLLRKGEQTQLRQRINQLRNASAADGEGGGTGGKPPTAAGGAGSGGGGGTLSVLRQILASVNGIREQLRTGVRSVKGGSGDLPGVSTTSPTRGARLAALAKAVDDQGNPDQRARAKAAAGQQRDLERLKAAGTLALEVERAQGEAVKKNDQINKSREATTRRSTEVARARARAELAVATALARLDTAAQHEVATLRQLIATDAKETEVVQQQARAYAAMNRALAESGVNPAGERHKQIRDVLSDVHGRKVSGPETDDIRRSAANVNGFKIVDKAMASQVPPQGIFGEQSAFTKAMFGNAGFWSRVMASTGTFVVRNFTAGFVFGLTNALQDVVRQAIITESTFIRVSDALEQTGRSSGNLRTQLQSISSAYGTNLEDVYATAAGLVGLFDNIDDIAGATRVVSQLQSISMGALNAQEAMGSLASITGAYSDELKGGVDGLTQVADVLTVVQNVIGSNVEVTAEGVGALSGLSKQLKIDFEDTATYVAQIAKLTNQTGAAAGEQFSRILAAMQTGRGRSALTKNLKGTGIESQLGSGDYGGALKTLLKNWDNLSDGQQRNIAVTVAGQRNARAFYALVSNSSKVLDASARAHNAQGQAAQRASAIANTLNGQIAKLTSNLTNLAQNLVRTGILDFFGFLLHVVNATLTGINKVFSVINDIADSNPITSFLKHISAGLVGFLVTAKLASLAIRGFRASLAELRAGEGLAAAGVQGALGGGQSVRASLLGAPASGAARTAAFAERVRTPRPRIIDYAFDRSARPGGLSETAPRGFVKQQRVVQGPLLPGGGFYSGAEAEASRARRAFATAASGTSKVLGGLSNTMNGVAASGIKSQAALAGVFAVLFAGIDGLQEHAARGDEYRRLYKDQTGSKSSTDEGPGVLSRLGGKIGNIFGGDAKKAADDYVGPYTDQLRKNIKETSGIWGGLKTGLATGVRGLNPKNWDGDFFSLNAGTEMNSLRGDLPGDTQKQIDELLKSLGRKPVTLGSVKLGSNGIPTGPQTQLDTVLTQQKVGKEQLDAAVRDIDKNKNLTEEQKTAAMAQLEALRKAFEENINSKILAAKGVASQDILSTDQLSKLDGVQQLLLGTATSGGGVDARNPQYAKLFEKRLEDTGIRKNSVIGTNLDQLAQGGLNKGDALLKVRNINDQAINQLQARIQAATKAGNDDEIETLQQALDQFIANQAQILQQIIDAVGSTASAIAEAAAGRGNFAGAAGAIRSGRDRIAGLRDRASESPEIRAQRDSVSAQQSEKAASLETQGDTVRLQRQKARGVGAQRSAQIDAESARIAYQNLLKEREAVRGTQAEGPTIQALRDAKNQWLSAQRTSAIAAQDANIAAMTAAAAGIWNGVAAASAQENIALQQYSNAKANFGAHSAEALGALANYKSAQKSTQTTLDQVAESRRQAVIASIPQGNSVAIARAQVGAARAALAAAAKYGQNSTEYQGALAQLYGAQQQAVAAQSAVAVAQAQLAVAYATARGDTVGAARAGERVARAQLAAAKKASGGARSADVLAAQAQAVQARAATRDAMLQDRLDTIDFNLQMGKITQSSAIAAMQQILRTANLTKQQRRDLLLKIKGMKSELSDSQFNFGTINLPTPYEMRRYVTAERNRRNASLKATVGAALDSGETTGGLGRASVSNVTHDTRVMINGADIAMVRRILEQVLGKSVKTRTAQGRRR